MFHDLQMEAHRIEGFDDDAMRTEAPVVVKVAGLHLGCHEQDKTSVELHAIRQLRQGRWTVHARHHHIQEQDLRNKRRSGLQRLGAARAAHQLEASDLGQGDAGHGAYRRVVLDM